MKPIFFFIEISKQKQQLLSFRFLLHSRRLYHLPTEQDGAKLLKMDIKMHIAYAFCLQMQSFPRLEK